MKVLIATANKEIIEGYLRKDLKVAQRTLALSIYLKRNSSNFTKMFKLAVSILTL